MKKLFENTAYWVGVLCLGIALGVTVKLVSAWVEPDQMPPGGNIAAPLNTGNVGQIKLGGLVLNYGGLADSLGLVISNGNVQLNSGKIMGLASPTSATDAATKGYVDAASGGGGGDSSGGTSGGGTIVNNKIPDMTPVNNYVEICFKDNDIKKDIHSSSESTQGGNCLPGDMGFIIEKSARDAKDWTDAVIACAKNNMRLPEVTEWVYVCKNYSDLNVNDIKSSNEWAGNELTDFYSWNAYAGLAVPFFYGSNCSSNSNEQVVGPVGRSVAFRCAR